MRASHNKFLHFSSGPHIGPGGPLLHNKGLEWSTLPGLGRVNSLTFPGLEGLALQPFRSWEGPTIQSFRAWRPHALERLEGPASEAE